MQQSIGLVKKLSESLNINKHRAECLVNLIVGMITSTVNLKQVCQHANTEAEAASCYRRFQRFFSEHRFNEENLAPLIWELFFRPNEKVILTIDRTNWEYGSENINIMKVAEVHKGIAAPLMWTVLDKRGSSHTDERIELIDRFISIFGSECIQYPMGDREFIGKNWFKELENKNVKFIIRIKNNTHIPRGNGVKTASELVIVATNMRIRTALTKYAQRWQIEWLRDRVSAGHSRYLLDLIDNRNETGSVLLLSQFPV